MLTIKEGVASVVAGVVGITALCISTDLGSDLSETGAHTAVHAATDPVVYCEPAQSPADEGSIPLVARLEFAPRDLPQPTARPAGIDTAAEAARATQPDRRLKQPGDAPTTLPASAAPPVFPSMTLTARKMSVTAVRALQSELKRHACYAADIDGDWGPASRSAAATFVAAVNAKLPVDQPNEFLLALSRQYQGPACRQNSSIITASTTRMRRATMKTDALSNRGGSLIASSRVSPYAPRLTSAPRIVSGKGAHRAIDLKEVPEMPLALPGDIDQATQMALGVEPPTAQRSEANSVTRHGTSQRKRDATRRAAASNRRSQPRKRPSRQRWKRQVFQSINLSGG